jgi:hypothetical protein
MGSEGMAAVWEAEIFNSRLAAGGGKGWLHPIEPVCLEITENLREISGRLPVSRAVSTMAGRWGQLNN